MINCDAVAEQLQDWRYWSLSSREKQEFWIDTPDLSYPDKESGHMFRQTALHMACKIQDNIQVSMVPGQFFGHEIHKVVLVRGNLAVESVPADHPQAGGTWPLQRHISSDDIMQRQFLMTWWFMMIHDVHLLLRSFLWTWPRQSPLYVPAPILWRSVGLGSMLVPNRRVIFQDPMAHAIPD